jgi:hypothetical protein
MGETIDAGSTETPPRRRVWLGILFACAGVAAVAVIFAGVTGRRTEPVRAAPRHPLERLTLASLEVCVRSDGDFAPLPGVRVVLESASDTLTLHTDCDGRFSLALVEPGEIEVRVEPGEPWEPSSRRLAVVAGRNEVDLVVERGSLER